MSLTIPKTTKSQIEYLVSCGIQAPSSHNTQPWQFSISDQTIFVYSDLTRRLKIGDPLDRELYTSIGAAIENILLGASALGISADLSLFPRNHEVNDLVASIKLSFPKKKLVVDKICLQSIWDRRTNRSPYNPSKKIPAIIAKNIAKISTERGLFLHLISDRPQIKVLGKLVESGMLKFLKKDNFRQELSTWIRHDWSKKGDGLPGYSLGMPGIISIMAPILIRSTSKIHEVATSENQAVQSCPSIGVIAIPKDTKEWWVKTGMLFEHIALKLHAKGIATAILTAAVESKVERVQLKKIIHGEPGLFFRLGYASAPGIAVPRRDLDHVAR